MIEGEARAEWGRFPVAAVVVVSFLLAALIGMTSATSPWVPGDGGGSSPPADRRRGARLCPCRRALHPAGGDLGPRARTHAAKKRPGGPAIATDELGSGLRAARLALSGDARFSPRSPSRSGFCSSRQTRPPPPPPSVSTVGDVPCAASVGAAPVCLTRLRLVPRRVGPPRSRSSCPSRWLPAAGFGSPTTRVPEDG